MKIARLTLFVSFCCAYISFTSIKSDPTIILRLQTTPYKISKSIEKEILPAKAKKSDQEKLEKLANDIQNPEKLNRKLLKANLRKKIIPSLSGFLATYNGYVNYSDQSGIITFLCRHTSTTKAYLLISPSIILNLLRGNSFSSMLTQTEGAELYSYEKKKDKNETFYWEVKKVNLPEDQKVNKLTVTILTKPKNIFVEIGEFPAIESPNLILPNNIYVINHDENAEKILNFLDMQRFFENLRIEKQKSFEIYNQEIIVNP